MATKHEEEIDRIFDDFKRKHEQNIDRMADGLKKEMDKLALRLFLVAGIILSLWLTALYVATTE